ISHLKIFLTFNSCSVQFSRSKLSLSQKCDFINVTFNYFFVNTFIKFFIMCRKIECILFFLYEEIYHNISCLFMSTFFFFVYLFTLLHRNKTIYVFFTTEPILHYYYLLVNNKLFFIKKAQLKDFK